MSAGDPDDTLTILNKLRAHLAVYRKRHGGKDPARIEVHPKAYRIVINACDKWQPGSTGPTYEGIPIKLGAAHASTFIFVDA